jgi:hypothetical protein
VVCIVVLPETGRKSAVSRDRKTGKDRNVSRAVQSAVDLLGERNKRRRLARELSKIDPREEKEMAEHGQRDSWPEY